MAIITVNSPILPFLILTFLFLNSALADTESSGAHDQTNKYPNSRTYKITKTNSSLTSSSSSLRKSHRSSETEVPVSDNSDHLVSRSLATPSSRDNSESDYDQISDDSINTPIKWADRYPRDSKSLPLPTVRPRYAQDDLKYSSQSTPLNNAAYSYPYNYNYGMMQGAYSTPQSYYANPLLDTYPYYEKERVARELLNTRRASLSGIASTMAASASSLFGYPHNPSAEDSYEDNLALGGHHHHHHSSHHHHGWGWKGHDHKKTVYVEKYDNNAIGLLGLLGVLSLLSNVLLLLTTTTTTAAAGRKKRSLLSELGESEESKRQRIFLDVLPYLAPVAHAKNGQIPVECTLQGICLTNRLLVNEYGHPGRAAGDHITTAIVDLLNEQNDLKHKEKLTMAGRKGRNQRDCRKIYPRCKALQQHGAHQIPFVIGIDDVPKLLVKVKHVSANSPMRL